MSEVDFLKNEIARCEKKLEEEQVNEDIKTLTENIHKIYSSFLDAGFSDEQAWWFVGTMFAKAIEIATE